MWARQYTSKDDERKERGDEENHLYGKPQHEIEEDDEPEERLYGEQQHEVVDRTETPEERKFELVVPPARPTKITA